MILPTGSKKIREKLQISSTEKMHLFVTISAKCRLIDCFYHYSWQHSLSVDKLPKHSLLIFSFFFVDACCVDNGRDKSNQKLAKHWFQADFSSIK